MIFSNSKKKKLNDVGNEATMPVSSCSIDIDTTIFLYRSLPINSKRDFSLVIIRSKIKFEKNQVTCSNRVNLTFLYPIIAERSQINQIQVTHRIFQFFNIKSHSSPLTSSLYSNVLLFLLTLFRLL